MADDKHNWQPLIDDLSQRREQALSEVPLAVTALTGEFIRDVNLDVPALTSGNAISGRVKRHLPPASAALPAPLAAGVVPGDRAKAERHVLQHLDEDAAEAHHYHHAELRVAHRADRDLPARGAHLLDEEALHACAPHLGLLRDGARAESPR